jgi:hypothetical protein
MSRREQQEARQKKAFCKEGNICIILARMVSSAKMRFALSKVEIGGVCVTPARRRRKTPAVERDVEIDSGFNGAWEVYTGRLHVYST